MGSTPLLFIDDVTIQPPPLCGPSNLNSQMACLERNGNNTVYNISMQQMFCSLNITNSFSLDCPLTFVRKGKIRIYVYISVD